MKENLLFFYKRSYGELNAGLPFILEIIQKRENLDSYFVFKDQEIFDDLPFFYKSIIKENFKLLCLKKSNFFVFYFKNLLCRNFIFTCDSGHTPYSSFLTCYWPFSRVAFFAHAYALLNESLDSSAVANTNYPLDKYSGYHHASLVVAHNRIEIKYREKFNFFPENIIIAGNLGYKSEWINYFESHSGEQKDISQLKNKYTKTVFIPVRDIHAQYLTSLNSDYLFETLSEVVKVNDNYLFLIKVHPRQKNVEMFFELEKHFANVKLVDINTTIAASLSDLVVSYWSSAITDALAVNTPTVEFHRHDFFHGQLVKTDKGLVSLYHYYGLCPFYQEKNDVLDLLESPERWEDIRRDQQKKYKNIFLQDYPRFVEELYERFNKTPFRKDYLISFFSFPASIFKKYFKDRLTNR